MSAKPGSHQESGGGQEEKGMPEDEMAGWHHRLDGHEFERLRIADQLADRG